MNGILIIGGAIALGYGAWKIFANKAIDRVDNQAEEDDLGTPWEEQMQELPARVLELGTDLNGISEVLTDLMEEHTGEGFTPPMLPGMISGTDPQVMEPLPPVEPLPEYNNNSFELVDLSGIRDEPVAERDTTGMLPVDSGGASNDPLDVPEANGQPAAAEIPKYPGGITLLEF